MAGKMDNRALIREVYAALLTKGYSPVNQLAGFLLTGDPTYITNNGNARALMSKVDRVALLQDMLNVYLLDIKGTEKL